MIQVQLPPFDVVRLGATGTTRPDIQMRRLYAAYVKVVGTKTSGNTTAPITVEDVVESVLVVQDDVQKMKLLPRLKAKYDSLFSANDNVLPADYLHIPLYHYGLPASAWGTGNIKRLDFKVNVKAAGSCPAGTVLTDLRGVFDYLPRGAAEKRGPVFLQNVINTKTVKDGWNEITDLDAAGYTDGSFLLLDSPGVKAVRVTVGDVKFYDRNKADALAVLARNPAYNVPATVNNAYNDAVPGFFPVLFGFNDPSDFLPLTPGGVRRALKLEFEYDSTLVNGSFDGFNVLLEGVEQDAG